MLRIFLYLDHEITVSTSSERTLEFPAVSEKTIIVLGFLHLWLCCPSVEVLWNWWLLVTSGPGSGLGTNLRASANAKISLLERPGDEGDWPGQSESWWQCRFTVCYDRSPAEYPRNHLWAAFCLWEIRTRPSSHRSSMVLKSLTSVAN